MYEIVNKQVKFLTSQYRHLQKCLYKGLCPKLSTNINLINIECFMEKKLKLYAYKIENDKISTSHSDFYDKIVLKLS